MTLKDIAEKAGVSMMTVSNVINQKQERVSQSTIDKVNEIIKECHYVPNMTARSLTAKSSKIIGIIVSVSPKDSIEQSSTENYFDNPYVSTMIGIIEPILKSHGYFAMIRSVDGVNDIQILLKNWNVDGILFLYPFLEQNFNQLIRRVFDETPLPMVIFDSYNKNPNIINISSNDKKGLYLSTKYLINHGHERIAFVADYKNNPLLTARFEGYVKALKESNLPVVDDYILNFPPSYNGGIRAGQKIASMETAVTAAVSTADICAIGIMEGARLGGLRIPADLSVIGFDDLKLCNYTSPKLTTISQHISEKAAKATNLLLQKIENGKITTSHFEMDVELVERQSVMLFR